VCRLKLCSLFFALWGMMRLCLLREKINNYKTICLCFFVTCSLDRIGVSEVGYCMTLSFLMHLYPFFLPVTGVCSSDRKSSSSCLYSVVLLNIQERIIFLCLGRRNNDLTVIRIEDQTSHLPHLSNSTTREVYKRSLIALPHKTIQLS
jgi:hypothetical protein